MSRPVRGRTRRPGERHGWLDLLQRSGPFVTLPLVERVFPDGLPDVPAGPRATVRAAVAELLDRDGRSQASVVEAVLCQALDWNEHLRRGSEIPDAMAHPVPEHGVLLRADLALVADEEPAGADDEEVAPQPWRLLGSVLPYGTHPLARTSEAGWTASPVERLAVLLRARDVPVGLTTDGRWWAVVWAPAGGTTGAAVWDAGLWSEEPDMFRAFVALLHRGRFLGVAATDTLPQMLQESLGRQEEVTTTLGRQVRTAVELLLSTFDALDGDAGGDLLDGVSDEELYDGVVTVMMRIVFLLFAEERNLLPADDDVYAAAYGVSRLADQLAQAQALAGEQVLAHRTGAWHRLLAVTRALHAGVAHEDLRLPAYGGGLFDPDRYPWLEGRGGQVPAVDDRTVLRMLQAVQEVDLRGERRRLSFRTLDVEQIGYVYEGLLELEVRTADEVVLSLARPAKWPRGKAAAEVPLSQARERLGAPSGPTLAQWIAERTGWSATRVAQALQTQADRERRGALVRACGGDEALADEVEPYAGALHVDPRGLPAVTLPGRRYLAPGTRRASTGAHYTPRSLAEDIVINTLEPLVYRPGPLETSDRATWRIRPSVDVLALRVADIAMGSGAFLVAACRYLADRLLDARAAEGNGVVLRAQAAAARSASDAEVEAVALDARREIAEHCLYGVDVNPLAVEMAKLSLWLVTMDRSRPFGFLDDRLVAGDSLLGLASLRQLQTMHAHPDGGPAQTSLDDELFAEQLGRAADLRRRITAHPVATPRDVEYKLALLAKAREVTTDLVAVADAVTATGMRVAGERPRAGETAFANLAIGWSGGSASYREALSRQSGRDLQAGRPTGTVPRRPLHWPIAFPEVFADADHPGFDAIVGNPPFLGGQKISGTLGTDYAAWLQRWDGRGTRGSADLAARFVLRAERLLARRGQLGYIATNTLVQGDTLHVGLAQAADRGLVVRRGRPSHAWPSDSANLEIVDVWASKAPLTRSALRWLDGDLVPSIGADLEPVGRVAGRPRRLPENDDLAFQGSNVLGLGFTMTQQQASELIARDPRNADVLQSYVIGQDLNQRRDCSAGRWIINFRDWPLGRAQDYPDALEIVERLVKPERDRNKRAQRRDRWWIYAERAPDLYRAIDDLDHVLAISLVGSAVMPVRVPTGPVFAHACGVFALDDMASLAVLSSSVHQVWTIRYTSTLETRIRYAPSDVFLTLPRPESTLELERLGERLDRERRALMLSRAWGLTTTYNHVHDPRDPEVLALRDLHTEIDEAVLRAYGWDLDLEVGHHPTKIGTRWTVSPRARFELLDLLLEENHRRAGVTPALPVASPSS